MKIVSKSTRCIFRDRNQLFNNPLSFPPQSVPWHHISPGTGKKPLWKGNWDRRERAWGTAHKCLMAGTNSHDAMPAIDAGHTSLDVSANLRQRETLKHASDA